MIVALHYATSARVWGVLLYIRGVPWVGCGEEAAAAQVGRAELHHLKPGKDGGDCQWVYSGVAAV